MTDFYFCLHCHFYQPPRENPWTNEYEKELSAYPFDNWNERIYQDCYKQNTEAKIIDNTGKVVKLLNNFEYINFDFGPTLCEWMRKKHPDTFQKILEADKLSCEKFNGKGNAIAQVYNHIIMPLATDRDKITQVKWGKKYFKHFFKRETEGMWLSETAVNYRTIDVLIDEGIKFIILDPMQAERFRKLGESEWKDLSNTTINTKMPYRCYSKKNPKKYIDVFFYDSFLSKNIAFGSVAYSSENFFEAIKATSNINSDIPQLINAAVDGETFGHHKPNTERTLAHLFLELLPQRNYKVINYSKYLELFPPTYEVELKSGTNDEGTSWSCAHGVERWKSDCGCNTGRMFGWNQKWRAPLREALNSLRDKLSIVFEFEGKGLLKDVWEARNDYIHIMIDNSPESINEFFSKHQCKQLKEDEIQKCLLLLEMEKCSLFMFTSCGWFFDDIGGLEARKILEFSKRAIELAERVSNIDLKTEFLEKLESAKSNLPEFQNGKEIFLNLRD
ncbi:MAG: DUF3536 domain-containing protein [Ignavibacteria bacterium]|nr:DUF3536 domain-containing protein [Ignavibacteria bacterium]